MRVIGGRLKGRRLIPPKDRRIRPSKARTREAVFNSIESRYRDHLLDGNVADLFAGTGAMGIEALSRGARHAVFVDSAPDAIAAIRQNLTALDLTKVATVIQGEAGETRLGGPFDLIFMDPPYGTAGLTEKIKNMSTFGCISANTILVLEMGKRESVPTFSGFKEVHKKVYGNSKIAVFSAFSRQTSQ